MPRCDMFLQLLAALAQETGYSLNMTVFVAGEAINGLIIGRDDWMRRTAELLQNGLAGRAGLNIAQVFADGVAAETLGEQLEQDEDQPALQPDRYGYLHLAEARYGMDAPPHPRSGTLVRVDISRVAAWSYGSQGRG